MLNANQVDQFKQDGVLIAEDVLTAEDLQPCIDAINSHIDGRAKASLAEGHLTDSFSHLGFDKRLHALQAQDESLAAGLDTMQALLPEVWELFSNKNLLDAVESIIGPEISLNPIQHLRPKMPIKMAENDPGYSAGTGSVPWHQDAGVMWEESDESYIVNCWIPLVDATEENGCMKLIPGIHEYIEHQKEGGTTIRPDLMPDASTARLGACAKGGIVFLNALTPHIGLPNLSDHIRWTLDIRYHRTGEASGRPFWPSFILRSKSNPASVQSSYEAWCSRWKSALKATKGVGWHRTVPHDQRIPEGVTLESLVAAQAPK